jgi:SAM-dependent methyltransferase
MDKEYYKEYYELERNHWWFKVRIKIICDNIRKNINPSGPIKILNIGAATGRTSEILQDFGHVVSVEYDHDCYLFTKEKLRLEIYEASITALPFDDSSFDLVCAFDVLEHVVDQQEGTQEMHRVCRKDGYIFITVPAFMSLWSQHDIINHHVRRYTLNEIKILFKALPGNIVTNTYFNSFLLAPIFILRKASQFIKRKNRQPKKDSDFGTIKNPVANKFFYSIFSFERRLLKHLNFPAGVSILFLWKKL